MAISYSSHAVERMMRRDISTFEVEEILLQPDGVIRQSMDKIIAYKHIQGRRDNAIALVAVELPEDFHVVTVLVNLEVNNEGAS